MWPFHDVIGHTAVFEQASGACPVPLGGGPVSANCEPCLRQTAAHDLGTVAATGYPEVGPLPDLSVCLSVCL
jgi:hypothetical protein